VLKLIKLITGEEIVAEMNAGINTTWLLKNPMRLMMVGEGQLAFMPYLMFAEEEEVEIDDKHIVHCLTPTLDIQNNYNRKFGSGIIMPNGAETNLINEEATFGGTVVQSYKRT